VVMSRRPAVRCRKGERITHPPNHGHLTTLSKEPLMAASIARSATSTASFAIARPKRPAKVLHMQDRREYLAHVTEQQKLLDLAKFNLTRQTRIRELSAMLKAADLPRFLMEPADIRETVKFLASDDDRFAEAVQTIRFAGTYSARQEGWKDLDAMLGLTLEVEEAVPAQ